MNEFNNLLIDPTSPNQPTNYVKQDPVGPVSEVQQRVKSTPIYQQAYELFSNEPDSKWLMQLESIVSSISDVTDRVFNKKKVADANNKLFSDAIQAIGQLIRDYQIHVNSLPKSQVNQLEQAGINAAVTGTDVNPSEVPEGSPTDYQYPDIAGDLETSLGFFNTVSSLFSAASGGITSFMNAFNAISQTGINRGFLDVSEGTLANAVAGTGIAAGELDLKRSIRQDSISSSLLNVANTLSEYGVTNVPLFDSWSSFNQWYNNTGRAELAKLNAGNKTKKLTYSNLSDIYFSGVNKALEGDDRFMNTIIDKGLQAYEYQRSYEAAKAKYDSIYQISLDPVKMAQAYTDQTAYQTALLEAQQFVSSEKRKLWEFNEKLIPDLIQDAKTPKERAILFRLLYGVSSDEFAQLNSQRGKNIATGIKSWSNALIGDWGNPNNMAAGAKVAAGSLLL